LASHGALASRRSGDCKLGDAKTGAWRPPGGSITGSRLAFPAGIIPVVYLLLRWLRGLLTILSRDQVSKDAEVLVLRHENTVLRRQIGPVCYQPADRLWLTALSRLLGDLDLRSAETQYGGRRPSGGATGIDG
jgi:hypothetical protein